YMQNSLVETDSDVWPQIEPLLDAAMAGLSKADHHALVLRFFDGKSMREVGAALGASEDAAKMRVNRVVEKLRLFFSRRGIVVSVAILTAAISANSVQAAPATLAKTATAFALAKGATASTSTSTLINGVLKIMAWTKAKTAIVAAAVTLLLTGTATVVVKNISQPIPPSAQPLTARSHPEAPGPDSPLVLPDGGQGHPVPEHSPNARFANLTPQQRVEQARRH